MSLSRRIVGSSHAFVGLVLFAGACAQGSEIDDGPGGGGSSDTGVRPPATNTATNGNGGAGGSIGSTTASTTTASSSASGEGGQGGAPDKCGNGMLDAGESCDGVELNGATCATIGQGFIGGTLACDATCGFDTSQCQASPTCGNGAIDAGEDCEPGMLGGATCQSASGLASGMLGCTAGCAFDTTGCYQCGNGALDGPEVCDGTALGGQSCTSLGHDAGTLVCAANCLSFNETSCTDCGDGTIEGSEACDGVNLGGASCQSLGFSSGTLSCNADCTRNVSQCSGQTCGNGVREGTEVCDIPDLAGQTCQGLGFLGGSLGCLANCTAFNTAGCTGSQCSDLGDNDGDGFVDANDPGCSGPEDNDEFIAEASCGGMGGPIYDVSFADLTQDVIVTGTTVNSSDVFTPTDDFDDCSTSPANSSNEVILRYRNPVFQSSITFSLDNAGTNFDSVLYIRQGSCTSLNEYCNDDLGFFNVQSEVTLLDVPAGDYYIFVDGYGTQSGNYQLLIDLPN